MNFFLIGSRDYGELMPSREEVSQLIIQNVKRGEKNSMPTNSQKKKVVLNMQPLESLH